MLMQLYELLCATIYCHLLKAPLTVSFTCNRWENMKRGLRHSVHGNFFRPVPFKFRVREGAHYAAVASAASCIRFGRPAERPPRVCNLFAKYKTMLRMVFYLYFLSFFAILRVHFPASKPSVHISLASPIQFHSFAGQRVPSFMRNCMPRWLVRLSALFKHDA